MCVKCVRAYIYKGRKEGKGGFTKRAKHLSGALECYFPFLKGKGHFFKTLSVGSVHGTEHS